MNSESLILTVQIRPNAGHIGSAALAFGQHTQPERGG